MGFERLVSVVQELSHFHSVYIVNTPLKSGDNRQLPNGVTRACHVKLQERELLVYILG